MAQNNNIVVYALLPAGSAQQPPAGQTYHLQPFTLVGEYSHRRPDRQSISALKLAMGVSHHPINKPPPEYLCWRDAVKDQMLARGYISDNWHFPEAEFQQIVEGMRRLQPTCDELATASAANNMASMQEIDEAVRQLVKDCGKKLANTIRTNNHVPPPCPGVPPAQDIVRPMLLTLNAPPPCQWSIATAVVPNAGPVGQNAPLANAPGPAQNIPAPPAGAQAGPAPLGNPQAQNNAAPPGPADPEAQNDPPPPGPANPQGRIGLRLGNVYRQKDAHQPANIPGQIHSAPSRGILGTPLGIKHTPANLLGPINLPGSEDIPVQIESGPSMGILGTPLGIKHAPANPQGPINLPGQAERPVQIQADPPMGILGTPLGIKQGPANPPGPINLPGQEDIPVQIQADRPMGILGTPLGIKHAPANPPGPNNLPGPEDIPVQIQADPLMGILGRAMVIRHAPLADILEAAAANVEDPLIQSFDVAWRVRRAVSGLSQISEFFWQ